MDKTPRKPKPTQDKSATKPAPELDDNETDEKPSKRFIFDDFASL